MAKFASKLRSSRPQGKMHYRKLAFETPAVVPMLDRDFGLIRIPRDKSSTPFPRASTALDMKTLKARLETEWETQEKSAAERLETRTHFIRSIKSKAFIFNADRMPQGTPHPQKGVVLNPKLLKRQLGNIDKKPGIRSFKRISDGQSVLSELDLTRKRVSTFRKSPRGQRAVRQSKPLVSCLRKDNSKVPKKVTILTPRISATGIGFSDLSGQRMKPKVATPNGTVTPTDSNQLTFIERRKLFCEGEFTIAKNGKKMSEAIMGQNGHAIDMDDGIFSADQKATEEIEMFIRKQGLLKAHAGTLTITSNLKGIRSNSIASVETIKSVPSSQLLQKK